ncbi:PLA2G16 [Mytilus edulis]|uniref:PLA2G16 n=1 Tax=Mytilus edulis TaxID=6550 RepID=A0A8S3R1F2_MYTED|nr:PLA2G16 [Mytilus edulis]
MQIMARDSELDHNKQVLAELRKGDLVEIKRWEYMYSHWAVYSGRWRYFLTAKKDICSLFSLYEIYEKETSGNNSRKGKVIHLTGIAGPSNSNSNSSHLFYICGEPFDKAIVKEEEYWSVVGNSKAENNNRKGKVIHLTGIAGPSNSNSNSSHLFYICGEPFDKAIVKKEEFWSVVGNSKAEINNSAQDQTL